MTSLKKLFIFICLTTYSAVAFSAPEVFADRERYAKVKEETMTIIIRINSDSYSKMKDIPKTGYLEVYTILGERIKRIDLKKCEDGTDLELSKGLYILRAGKVTQKIIVR